MNRDHSFAFSFLSFETLVQDYKEASVIFELWTVVDDAYLVKPLISNKGDLCKNSKWTIHVSIASDITAATTKGITS